jgi:hypothetical protein
MSLQSAVLALTKPVPLHVQLHQHHPCVPAVRRIASGLDNPCSGANSASITSHIWQQKVRLSDALGGRWAPLPPPGRRRRANLGVAPVAPDGRYPVRVWPPYPVSIGRLQ